MKVLKFNTSENQKVFFGSDFHLSHLRDFVWQARGHNSVQSHADAVIDGINARVRENDILVYLGDYSLNSNPDETKEYFRRIKCKNILYVWGNHESSTRAIYRDAVKAALGILSFQHSEVYPLKWENVKFLGNSAFISVDDQMIVISHFAHYIWDMMQHGAWNICGHSHSNCPLLSVESDEGKILDVGVDNALKHTNSPCFSFEEVKAIMDKKRVVVRDHHNAQTT